MNPLTQKIGLLLLFAIAFVDGVLIARSLKEKNLVLEEPEISLIESEPELEPEPEQEPAPEPEPENLINVPFTVQAPLGWKDPWNDYDEEAIAFMLDLWLNELPMPAVPERVTALTEMGQFFADLDPEYAMLTYLNSKDFTVESIVNPQALFLENKLKQGMPIIFPIDLALYDNPYYQNASGRHTLLAVGFDEEHFLVHDPGTVKGEAMLVAKDDIISALYKKNDTYTEVFAIGR